MKDQSSRVITDLFLFVCLFVSDETNHNIRWHNLHELYEIMAWISNNTHCIMSDVITHPRANFNGGLTKPHFKLMYGWEITFYCFTWMVLSMP